MTDREQEAIAGGNPIPTTRATIAMAIAGCIMRKSKASKFADAQKTFIVRLNDAATSAEPLHPKSIQLAS